MSQTFKRGEVKITRSWNGNKFVYELHDLIFDRESLKLLRILLEYILKNK